MTVRHVTSRFERRKLTTRTIPHLSNSDASRNDVKAFVSESSENARIAEKKAKFFHDRKKFQKTLFESRVACVSLTTFLISALDIYRIPRSCL